MAAAVERLGGLDIAIANAGIGAQMTLIDGDAGVWDKTFDVNVAGTFNLVRAAGPHIAHRDGYFLVTSSLAAAVHLPLMSAYCASKAAVESLGDSLRIELRPTGAKVGVAYFAELDTDMTSRGFSTDARRRSRAIPSTRGVWARPTWSRRPRSSPSTTPTARRRSRTWGRCAPGTNSSRRSDRRLPQQASKGAGIRILTETVASPTLGDPDPADLGRFPQAKWEQ